MSIRCILVPTGPNMDIRRKLDAALLLCRTFETHIHVVFISPNPNDVLASLTGIAIAIGATLDKLESESRIAVDNARTMFETWCRDHGIVTLSPLDHEKGATSASFSKSFGDLETILAAEARLSDLVILDRPESPNPFTSRAFDAAVFSSGRLTLVTPPQPLRESLLDSVVIAWNGSLEGARALSQSTSLLKAAGRVAIFSAPQGFEASKAAIELARYLRWHGIVATHVYGPADSESTGIRILAAAREEQATMILMGAYTHSRARQYFLGGVTQHLLNHSHVPLLMAH